MKIPKSPEVRKAMTDALAEASDTLHARARGITPHGHEAEINALRDAADMISDIRTEVQRHDDHPVYHLHSV